MANSPLVIVEIGSNHGNSLDVVKRMIAGSKEAGCAYVKFQLFYLVFLRSVASSAFIKIPVVF